MVCECNVCGVCVVCVVCVSVLCVLCGVCKYGVCSVWTDQQVKVLSVFAIWVTLPKTGQLGLTAVLLLCFRWVGG